MLFGLGGSLPGSWGTMAVVSRYSAAGNKGVDPSVAWNDDAHRCAGRLGGGGAQAEGGEGGKDHGFHRNSSSVVGRDVRRRWRDSWTYASEMIIGVFGIGFVRRRGKKSGGRYGLQPFEDDASSQRRRLTSPSPLTAETNDAVFYFGGHDPGGFTGVCSRLRTGSDDTDHNNPPSYRYQAGARHACRIAISGTGPSLGEHLNEGLSLRGRQILRKD